MRDVIIFGGAIGSVLALSRELKKDFEIKIYVVCLNNSNDKFYKVSNSIDEVFLIETKDDEVFLNKYKKWFEAKCFIEKPIVYFASDYSCIQVSKWRNWFEEKSLLCLPSNEIIDVFNNKGRAELVATNSGLIVPRSLTVNRLEDAEKIINDFTFPVIVKPRDSESGKRLGFKVQVFDKVEPFLVFFNEKIINKESVLCQEFIPGGDENSFFYLFYRTAKGEIYENIGVKSIQSPREQGIMAKGILINNSEVKDIGSKFLNSINYCGLGGIEFKRYNGKYYFIEMSTRIEGFFLISSKSNNPLGKISYMSFNEMEVINSNKNNLVTYIDIHLMLRVYFQERDFVGAIREIGALLFNNSKVCINILSVFDIRPFLMYCKNIIIK